LKVALTPALSHRMGEGEVDPALEQIFALGISRFLKIGFLLDE
jgi:hypothetical protein